MKPRKLLTQAALAKLEVLTMMGVPLARCITDLQLDMSRPAVKKLLDIHLLADHQTSLNPEWLDPTGPLVQEQPSNYSYEGYFPLGHWSIETCKDL